MLSNVLVSTIDSVNIEQLADIADKIIEVATPTISSIGAVTSQLANDVFSPATSDIQWLRNQMDQLTAHVQAFTCHLKEDHGPRWTHSNMQETDT